VVGTPDIGFTKSIRSIYTTYINISVTPEVNSIEVNTHSLRDQGDKQLRFYFPLPPTNLNK